MLDGLDVAPLGFFGLFTDKSGSRFASDNLIETVSLALTPAFFPLLADGAVCLAGSFITEGRLSGSFQVEPSTMLLLGSGLIGLTGWRWRKGRTATS